MARDTTIFLVDDDPAVRDSLKVFLEAHGLRVRDFASGPELLRDGAPRSNDCLVCDLHMPVMSGLDLMATLARRGMSRPTILITGRADSGLRLRAQAAGAFEVLEKPFDGKVLLETIGRAVDAASASSC